MEQMAVSKFKVNCLSVLKRVHKTRQAVLVTRFGKPVAEVVPPSAPDLPKRWLGSMAGTGRISGDIVAPAADPDDWQALRG